MTTERSRRYAFGSAMGAALIALVIVEAHAQPAYGSLIVLGALAVMNHREFLALTTALLTAPLRAVSRAAAIVAALIPLALAASTNSHLLPACAAALLFLFALSATLAWLRARRVDPVQPQDLAALGITFAGHLLFVWPLLLLAAITLHPDGVLLAFAVVAAAKFNDIAAYLLGAWLGRHRMIPGVSPKKTWEGSLSGLFIGVLASFALLRLLPGLGERIPLIEALGFALIQAPLAQIGDLIASAVKRSVGQKDSSRAVPGFGGLIDVLDSLIFTAPLGYAGAMRWLT